MMRKLLRDRSGVTAIEFALIAIPFFFTLFGIVDLGRYGITLHSLGTLASATARQVIICYGNAVTDSDPGTTPTGCAARMSDAEERRAAPFLFLGSSSPSVTFPANGSGYTIQATLPFTPLMPFWGATLNNPTRTATLPLS